MRNVNDPSLFDPRPSVDRSVAAVGRAHPQTAKDAAARALPRTGSKRRLIMDWLAERGTAGATDDEIERHFGWTHQSASARRNSLMNDGLIVDSGDRRAVAASGNPAIVWVAVSGITVQSPRTVPPPDDVVTRSRQAQREGTR